jgi:6-phosphogluconolactonase
LERISKASTLPDGFDGKNYCADIHVSSNGKFLYASNRGHHSIAIFSISETGDLERIGIEPGRGDWPRNFILSPDNKFLLVANQNSSNITVFAVNQETGLLTFTGNQVTVSRPVALKF